MESLTFVKRQQNNNQRQQDGAGLPQLWIFLLIVLAVLLVLVMGTSFIMHMLQRRQRTLLSRRIANGEVDLEMLGLKRLNVPQEQIDKMSQYVWSADPAEEVKRPAPAAGSDHRHSTMFGQTVCPICLDDFVDGETQVRELPCNHIFHPECIDPFLLNNSSLCPVCKKSSLPPGFCPVEVTNVMVRRERLGRNMQRNRERMQAQRARQSRRHGVPTVVVTPSASASNNNADTTSQAPETSNQDTELGVIATNAPDTLEPPPEIASQGQAARRAWRRDRVASQHIREFEQHGEASRQAEAKRPLWRRMFGLN